MAANPSDQDGGIDNPINPDVSPYPADHEPTPSDFMELRDATMKTTADVRVPDEVAEAIAYRAGGRYAERGTVTPQDVNDYALDHIQVWGRFHVGSEERLLEEWVQEEANIPLADEPAVPYPEDTSAVMRSGYNPVQAAITRAIEEPGKREEHIEEALDALAPGVVANHDHVRASLEGALQLIEQGDEKVDIVGSLQGAYGFTAGEDPEFDRS